jgi:hypothetical protein
VDTTTDAAIFLDRAALLGVYWKSSVDETRFAPATEPLVSLGGDLGEKEGRPMTKRYGSLVSFAVIAAVGLAAVGSAQAQFLIDHYKVYPVDPLPSGLPVDLNDQFGPSNHVLIQRDKFANPVLKTIPPEVPVPFPGSLFYPNEHLSWWKITEEVLPPQTIHVTNQFGGATWEIGNAQYLLVPAVKNLLPGIVLNQHYKCYDATGHDALKTVDLADQFGIDTHNVLAPRYFCNPVEKLGPPPLVPSGPPPLPLDHLACYDIDPPQPGLPNVILSDQVDGGFFHVMGNSEMLCVPSRKRLDIPVLSPWGLVAFGVLLTGAMYATIRRRGASLKA